MSVSSHRSYLAVRLNRCYILIIKRTLRSALARTQRWLVESVRVPSLARFLFPLLSTIATRPPGRNNLIIGKTLAAPIAR